VLSGIRDAALGRDASSLAPNRQSALAALAFDGLCFWAGSTTIYIMGLSIIPGNTNGSLMECI
jgi:hypothetical protein